jgi:hypothetical protein
MKEDRATYTTSFNFQQDHMCRAEGFRQYRSKDDRRQVDYISFKRCYFSPLFLTGARGLG